MKLSTSSIIKAIQIVVFACAVIMILRYFNMADMVMVESMIDHNNYLVMNLKDKDKASDFLAILRKTLEKFIDDLIRDDPNNDNLVLMKERFKRAVIKEGSPDSKHSSYAVNKGEQMVFCIRGRDNGKKLVDFNTMMFVALHELAHLMTPAYGPKGEEHTDEFWNNMTYLIKKAIQKKIYKYHPYHIKPVDYCNTTITDTPYKM